MFGSGLNNHLALGEAWAMEASIKAVACQLQSNIAGPYICRDICIKPKLVKCWTLGSC